MNGIEVDVAIHCRANSAATQLGHAVIISKSQDTMRLYVISLPSALWHTRGINSRSTLAFLTDLGPKQRNTSENLRADDSSFIH